MKILAIVSGILVAVLVGILGGMCWTGQKQLADWRDEGGRLHARLADLSGRVVELSETVVQRDQMLLAASNEVGRLRSVLAKPAAPSPKKPDPPQSPSQRVRAYIGRELIGEAWLISSRVGHDPATGQPKFEPVVVLDQQVRGVFTVTNTVEREVVRQSTVNNTYLPERTYYPVYYPVYPAQRRRVVNNPPDKNPSPPRLAIPLPPRGKSPW